MVEFPQRLGEISLACLPCCGLLTPASCVSLAASWGPRSDTGLKLFRREKSVPGITGHTNIAAASIAQQLIGSQTLFVSQ